MVIEHIIKINVPDRLERIAVIPLLLYRRLRYGYPFRRIRLTQGKFAIVDSDDYMRLNRYKWYAARGGNSFYAVRGKWSKYPRKRRTISMHNLIIPIPDGYIADHINHNGLDNRNKNLRAATQAQNARNARYPKENCSSKYRGVCYNKQTKKWRAIIVFNRKRRQIGYFQDEKEAARAYDREAKKFFGEFAILNLATKTKRHKEKIVN